MTRRRNPYEEMAARMRRSIALPVSAFFLIDSLQSIDNCKAWLLLLTPFGMPCMKQSQFRKYFREVRDLLITGKRVANLDYSFKLTWESQPCMAMLRVHHVEDRRYEMELQIPGVLANAVEDTFGDGRDAFWCEFMPHSFYD